MNKLIVLTTLSVGLTLGSAAQAHNGLSEASALSLLPIAISVAAPVGLL